MGQCLVLICSLSFLDMSPDLENVDEYTRLLPHDVNQSQSGGRRTNEDSQSVDSLRKILGERTLPSASAEERLPYNGYLTVDLIHDLVSLEPWYHYEKLMACRSKAPIGTSLPTSRRAFATVFSRFSNHLKDGSRLS